MYDINVAGHPLMGVRQHLYTYNNPQKSVSEHTESIIPFTILFRHIAIHQINSQIQMQGLSVNHNSKSKIPHDNQTTHSNAISCNINYNLKTVPVF